MSEHDTNLRPKVGLGVMIIKDGKVLLGKRKGDHGSGEFCFPGGHVENMESLEECARREVREEAGIEIKNLRFLRVYNMKEYSPRHYLNLGFFAEWASGEVAVLEPDKFEFWQWYDLDDVPSPLFAAVPSIIDSYKTGKNFYDA